MVAAVQDRSTDRIIAATLMAGAAAALALLYAAVPGQSGLFPPCPLHALTGLYCPGCGTTRALHELVHGHVGAALRLNVLMMAALPFLLYAAVSYLSYAFRGRRLPTVHLSGRTIWALGIVIVLFGVLRNLPQYPFTLLAP